MNELVVQVTKIRFWAFKFELVARESNFSEQMRGLLRFWYIFNTMYDKRIAKEYLF